MSRGGAILLPREEVARRVDWLVETLRDETPELAVERADSSVVRLAFIGDALAKRFHAALIAENINANLDRTSVLLPIAPWYQPEDVESLALAVAKVAHYLE